MKFAKFVGAAALMSGMALSTAGAADRELVVGYWLTGDKASVVEIKACSEGSRRLCGDVVWNKGGSAEAAELITGMRASRSNLSKGHFWNNGKIVDQESGKKRDGSIEFLEDGTLKVASCKRKRCSNEIWERPSSDMAELPEHIRIASR